MEWSRPLHGATWLAVAMLCSVMGVGALAQPQSDAGPAPTLDPQLLNRQQAMSEAHKQEVGQYIDYYLQQLQSGAPSQISTSRDRLLDPLRRPQVPQGFMAGYSEVYVQRVLNQLSQGGDAMRLNVMVVIPRLAAAEALQLIEQGLGDQNPGVRYLASKGLAAIAQRDPDQDGLNQQQQLAALQLLRDAIGAEASNAVLTQLLEAMSQLDIPQAFDVLLQALIRRVEVHQANPGAPMMPERVALRNLFQNLVRLEAEGSVAPDPVREIARAAWLYMVVAATQAQDATQAGRPLNDQQLNDRVAMIQMTDQVLRWAFSEVLLRDVSLPQTITGALTRGDWPFILAQGRRWQDLLRQAGVADDQLVMPTQ
jgi:hypothetical protein